MTLSARNTRIYVAQYVFTADMKDMDASRHVDSYEDTTFGASAKTFSPSLKDGALKTSGFYTGGVGNIEDEIRQIFAASGQPVSVFFGDDVLTLISGAIYSGSPCFITSANMTDWKTSAAIGGGVMLAIGIKPGMTGKLVSGYTLHPLAAEVGTVNGQTVDAPAGAGGVYPTTTGWTSNLHVSAIAGAAPSVTVKLQHSTDGTTWADLSGGSFAAATAATSQQLSGAATASVNRYVRCVITFGGTTTSITLAVSFSRNV